MESSSTSSLAEQDDDDTCTSVTPKRATSSPRIESSYRQEKRKRRNTAALVQWIGNHPYNPYPTKAEKQNLAFLAGMTNRQLNDWFANARRNIKKMGMENWRKRRNGTLLGSGSSGNTGTSGDGGGGGGGGASEGEGGAVPVAAAAAEAAARMAYNQAAAGGYSLAGNYLVANQPMQGAADFRGVFAGSATPPGTPAPPTIGGLPIHAFNSTHSGSLVFSDSRLPVGSFHQPQAARHMSSTFFTPTAGYASGTPPAFQTGPCPYAPHPGGPVIEHPTHAHYPSPWTHLHSMRGCSWVLSGERAGNDDMTDQSSPENHSSIKSTSSSSSASSF